MHLFNEKDRGAFELVYKMLFPAVYYFTKRFVGYEDARDITADAFTVLWKMDKKFSSLQNIKNYLQTTARNMSINFNDHLEVVSRNHENIIISQDGRSESHNYKYEEDEIKNSLLLRIMAEIEKLSRQRKKIFELYYFGGLKEREIAAVLNISIRTVHNQKLVAVKQIRMAMVYMYIAMLYIYFISRNLF